MTKKILDVFSYLLKKEKTNYVYNSKKNIYTFYIDNKPFAIISNDFNIQQLIVRIPPKLYENLKEYDFIIPSFNHMNSFHWKSFFIDKIDADLLDFVISYSYDLTIDKMTKKEKFKYYLTDFAA